MRPILANSCASATSAAEARFRIDAPIEGRRGTRVIALDDAAATVVRRIARHDWNGARFYTLPAGIPGAVGNGWSVVDDDGVADIGLRTTAGTTCRLGAELADADVAIMIAAGVGDATAATAVGRACARRAITTAALVLRVGPETDDTVAALRPHARVLLVTEDEQDVTEVLSALRA